MTYLIAEPCIGSKDSSCVEVCPVSCIHPEPDEPGFDEAEQLYIDPTECIGCDACATACPVDAAMPIDIVPDEWQRFVEINERYFARSSDAA
jgi:ferredoxin